MELTGYTELGDCVARQSRYDFRHIFQRIFLKGGIHAMSLCSAAFSFCKVMKSKN